MLQVTEDNFNKAIHDLVDVITILRNADDCKKCCVVLDECELKLMNVRQGLLEAINNHTKKGDLNMDFSKVFEKGWKGLLATAAAVLIAQIDSVSALVTGFLPEEWATLTLAGIVAAIINSGANWLKHRAD